MQSIRTVETQSPAKQLPWLDELRGRPIVYITLGTVYNRNVDVFRALLDGLRDEALNIVVTVGRQNEPAMLGDQPSNIHVHRYIAQEQLLPHCAAVVTHGGAARPSGRSRSGCRSSSSRRAPITSTTPTASLPRAPRSGSCPIA